MDSRSTSGGKKPKSEAKASKGPDRRKAARAVAQERRRGDRRRDKRVPIELWIEEEEGDALYFQRAANLSAGGAFFAQTIPQQLGTEVNLRFTLPGEVDPIECRGEIVSALDSDDLGMGVRFIDLRPEDRARIAVLVEKHGR